MALRYPEIIAQAALLDQPDAASDYDFVLAALDDLDYVSNGNALDGRMVSQRRKVLGWLVPDVTPMARKIIIAILELQNRGWPDQTAGKHLANLLRCTNISHEFKAAQRWIQFKLAIHPLEKSCLVLPAHRKDKIDQPYSLNFHAERPLFSQILPGHVNWFDPVGLPPTLPILGSALRINHETVLILGQKGLITSVDRMRLVCELIGIDLDKGLSAVPMLRALPDKRQIVASEIVNIGTMNFSGQRVISVRPHVTEAAHMKWNLAVMKVMASAEVALSDIDVHSRLFANSAMQGIIADPREYPLDKVFVLMRGNPCEPIRMDPSEESPGRMVDSIVKLPGDHLTLEELKKGTNWPSVFRVFIKDSESTCVYAANQIALCCNVDPAAKVSFRSTVISALRAGDGLNLLLPHTRVSDWLADEEFCDAVKAPGHGLNIIIFGGPRTNIPLAFERQIVKLADFGRSRPIKVYLSLKPLAQCIAMFESKAIASEHASGKDDEDGESALDIVAHLLEGLVGGAASG